MLGIDVYLRDVLPADLDAFFQQQLDPEANRLAAFGAADPADRLAFIEKWNKILADPKIVKHTIVYRGEVAGNILSFVAPWSSQQEVSYWLGRSFWGQGIATRALTLLLARVKTRPLQARAAQDNGASLRVLQKCGFKVIGRDKAFSVARGTEVEEVVFELDSAPMPAA